MTCTHGKFQIPTDPHGKKRYESAMKHVEAAKKAGKSSEEIMPCLKRLWNSIRWISNPFLRMKLMLSIAAL